MHQRKLFWGKQTLSFGNFSENLLKNTLFWTQKLLPSILYGETRVDPPYNIYIYNLLRKRYSLIQSLRVIWFLLVTGLIKESLNYSARTLHVYKSDSIGEAAEFKPFLIVQIRSWMSHSSAGSNLRDMEAIFLIFSELGVRMTPSFHCSFFSW